MDADLRSPLGSIREIRAIRGIPPPHDLRLHLCYPWFPNPFRREPMLRFRVIVENGALGEGMAATVTAA
jgi:hypothetical protein